MLATSDLLKLLKAKKGGYISGEELSARLAVSRTAIWKHIRQLEAAGYTIAAAPHLGYRLLSTPDRLLPDEIRAGLQSKRFGWKIFCYQQTTSTNDRALELAADNMPEGTLVAAEHQTQGRGRRERTWVSRPYSNLLFTLIFRPPWIAEQAPLITLIMAVAVAKSINKKTGLHALIKWPNDVLVQNAKVAGILTEMQAQTDKIDFVVCGVGINVNAVPTRSLRYPAISLAKAKGQSVLRIPLLQQILLETEKLYTSALQQGTEVIIREWQHFSCVQGRLICIEQPTGEMLTGTVTGIDDSGALLLRLENGFIRRITSGEVHKVVV